jgi:SynChlorMet cassette protein ScmC
MCPNIKKQALLYSFSSGLIDLKYGLCLGDGQCWEISATEEVEPWLKKIGFCLGLEAKPLNWDKRMIFVGRGNMPDLERDEWEVHDYETIRTWSSKNGREVICELDGKEGLAHDIKITCQVLNILYQSVINKGGLPFHAGLAAKDAQGVLLAGSGGVGKTTACLRFPASWEVFCDDESVVVCTKSGKYEAHSVPRWKNNLFAYRQNQERPKELNFINALSINNKVPLSAIFFLEHADRDEVCALHKAEAAIFIKEVVMQNYSRILQELRLKTEGVINTGILNNACELIQTIPAFRLRLTLTGRFWEQIEEILKLCISTAAAATR